jgi:nucleoside-diphosphate-sugar epimerase
MRIGITGATGFIGSHLVRHLESKGHHVIAFGRGHSHQELLKYAQFVQWDFTQVHKANFFSGDIFIHCGGFVDFWGPSKEIYRVNVIGTKNVLSFASNVKKFIYISSASIYDGYQSKNNISEGVAYAQKFSNEYAETKTLAEIEVRKFAKNVQSTIILRPHAVYGPGDRHVVHRVLRTIRNGSVFIIGSGQNLISITHVGNISQAVSLGLRSNKKGLQVYNVTDRTPFSVNDLYMHLFHALKLNCRVYHLPYAVGASLGLASEQISKYILKNKQPLLTVDIARQCNQESTISIARIKKDLNYRAPFGVQQGFFDLNLWLESIGGVKKYIATNHINPWAGKLFTY